MFDKACSSRYQPFLMSQLPMPLPLTHLPGKWPHMAETALLFSTTSNHVEGWQSITLTRGGACDGLQPISRWVFQQGLPRSNVLFQLCTSQIQSGVTLWILILKHTHGPKEKCYISREEGPVEGAASMTHVSQLDAMFLMSRSSSNKPCICFSHMCLTSNQLLIDKHARDPFKK